MFYLHFTASVGKSNANPAPNRTLSRQGWSDFVFAFHDREEIGPRMSGFAHSHGPLN